MTDLERVRDECRRSETGMMFAKPVADAIDAHLKEDANFERAYHETVAEARAENARLREALERVEKLHGAYDNAAKEAQTMADIARNALRRERRVEDWER